MRTKGKQFIAWLIVGCIIFGLVAVGITHGLHTHCV